MMRKLLLAGAFACLATAPLAQTIDALGSGTAPTGTELVPVFQGSNPAVHVTSQGIANLAPVQMPVYIAGRFLVPQGHAVAPAAGAAMVAGTTYFAPIYLKPTATFSTLTYRITTASSGAAAYNVGLWGPGSGICPGSLVATGTSQTNTLSGVQNNAFLSNYQVTVTGVYWVGFQAPDTAMRMAVYSTAGDRSFMELFGAGANTDVNNNTMTTGVSLAGTVGTLPTSGAGCSEVTTGVIPDMGLLIASVP
jgi:hypothetical protein